MKYNISDKFRMFDQDGTNMRSTIYFFLNGNANFFFFTFRVFLKKIIYKKFFFLLQNW